jgi:hypothetical protein
LLISLTTCKSEHRLYESSEMVTCLKEYELQE